MPPLDLYKYRPRSPAPRMLRERPILDLLEAADLSHVETAARTALWHGGSVFAQALQLTFLQLGEEILSKTDVTEQDLSDMDELLADPGFTVVSQLVVAAWGQRPTGA